MTTPTFSELADQFAKQIKGACKRIHAASGSDLCEVADLVQEAHLRLWEKREQVLQAKYPYAYVSRLTHNAASSHIETLRRQFTPPIDLTQFAGIAG